MRTKLRSKKGVTLTEVIITLVVSSIFFVMVGSIIVAYRNVTNTAINTTSATSAATLVGNSFEKMTNFCNSSEDNHLYYKRNADNTFVFYVYQGDGTPTMDELNNNPKYRIMEYTTSTLYYTNSVTGLEIKVDTNNLSGIRYRVTNGQILKISILDSEEYLIMERTYRLYGSVQMVTGE
ncbi:MAG: prepilin-type N-terminal cleavage/methylation domain-containing protein [Bacilli bacterium]